MPLLTPPGSSAAVTNTIIVSSSINTINTIVVTSSINITDTIVISASINTTNNYSGTGFATASLLISAASLSGGMQLAAATGTLPQRLTMTDGAYITASYQSVTVPVTAVVIDQVSNAHIWTTGYHATTNSKVRRYRISDGVYDLDITGSTTDLNRNKHLTASAYHLSQTPGTNGRMWGVKNSSDVNTMFVFMVDPNNSPPSCEVFKLSDTPPTNTWHVVEHIPGKILVRSESAGAGQYIEYAYNGTGSTNTCVYTGVKTLATLNDVVVDASGSVYMLTGLNSIVKAPATTLTASATITAINATYASLPGYGNTWRNAVYHPQANKLYVKLINQPDSADWFAVNLSTFAVEERVFGPVEFGNPVGSHTTAAPNRNGIGFTTDGTLMAFMTHDRNPTGMTTYANLRTLRLNPQLARWTWTPGFSALVTLIGFTGMMNNDRGFLPYPAGNAWFQSERDKRWTKFYYSLDGGVNRTEFVNSDELSISVSSAQTLTVDCEMQVKLNNMNGTLPYIADSTGNAATIFYKVVT